MIPLPTAWTSRRFRPTTTVEAIVEKVVDLVKQGKLREISDIRDETGLNGPENHDRPQARDRPGQAHAEAVPHDAAEDSFSCNFNVLVNGVPRVMGVRELLGERTSFRVSCVRRRTACDLQHKQEKLHLLRGLQAILLDIDKAVRIVRETDEESEVVPNLMIGFGIDETQAEFVAEIRLRHLNREYILKRTEEISQLEKDAAELQAVLGSEAKLKSIIVSELREVARKYGQPRRSMLLYSDELEEFSPEDDVPDYPVHLFFTREGYFKKITPQSLRMSGEQKLKEGDEIASRSILQRGGAPVLHRSLSGLQGEGLRLCGYKGQCAGRIHPCPPWNGRGGKRRLPRRHKGL